MAQYCQVHNNGFKWGGGGGGGGNPGVRGQKVGENFQKSGSFLVKCEVISVVWGGRQDVGTPLSPPPPIK